MGNPVINLEVLDYDFYGCYGHSKHANFPYCDAVERDCTYDFAESHKLVKKLSTNECSLYFVFGTQCTTEKNPYH